ncbi:MAG: hypothetical protein RR779_18255 [Comamonas sp.]
MRAITTSFIAQALALVLAAPALAQQTAAPAEQPAAPADAAPANDKYNQKAEYIRVEDAGSRIDEVRIGGQTQSIHVQPKVGNMPAYEVKPTDGARSRPDGFGETQNKKRVWNIGNF